MISSMTGFAVVRTAGRLWLWEGAQDWDQASPAPELPVNILQVTGPMLAGILDDFLGPDEGPAREAAV